VRIAANCIRSLLVQASPTPADLTLARHLLPRLIAFATNVEPEDPEGARPLVAHVLCQWAAGAAVAPERKPVAVALVVPTLLARASAETDGTESGNAATEAVFRETGARLLELAAVDPVAFRGVVAGMSEGQKAFMEEVITSGRRQAGGDDEEGDGARSGQPSIALKMDFGGQ
jgi:hypothetical protein